MTSHSEQATQSGIVEAPNNDHLSKESLSDSQLSDEHVSEDHPSDVKTDNTPNPAIRALDGYNSTSGYPVSTMAKFPPVFYCKKETIKADGRSHTQYVLGAFLQKNDPALFNIGTESKTGAFQFLLTDGPSRDDPVLIEVSGVNRAGFEWSKDASIFNFHLPPLDSLPELETALTPTHGHTYHRLQALSFDIEVNGKKETFQWRPTGGQEVKTKHDVSEGWKLVRKSELQPGHGGERKERLFGFCSDGSEIAAILSKKKHKPNMKHGCYKFSFIGNDLTGTLGQRWETMAVASGHLVWITNHMVQGARGATAGIVLGTAFLSGAVGLAVVGSLLSVECSS